MSEKNTILIADDKEVNRECLTRLLEDDYNILQASDGYEALEILDKEKEKISAVVLDIIMPGLDGYGVLQKSEVVCLTRWHTEKCCRRYRS